MVSTYIVRLSVNAIRKRHKIDMGYSVHSGRHAATAKAWAYKPAQDTTCLG